MRVLLMSPLMTYQDRWGQYHKGAGDTFPVGIGSIAGYLEHHGWQAEVIEPDILGMDEAALREFLRQGRYDLVGISAFTTNVDFAFRTAALAKAELPQCRVVLGGAHPTLFPGRSLEECPAADFCVTNEGEIPTLRLLEALRDGGDLARVPNLWFRSGDDIVQSGERAPWLDLDELPPFPYHKFDLGRYVPAPSLRRVLPTFNYMAQRGCPFACAFCDTRTHGRKVRYRSVARVIQDLEALRRDYGVRGIVFEGSNFTADHRWVRELCEELIARKMNLSWYCMGRLDLRHDLLPLMRKAGCWGMSFGIESANEATLKRMNKRIHADQARATLLEARRQGIRTIGSFILGYPGEDEAATRATIKYSCEVGLDVAVYFIPVPFPGTLLHEHATADGGLRQGLTWRDYGAWLDHNHPIYINPLLGERHVALYNEAFRSFYARPGYVLRQALSVRSPQDALRLFKGFFSVAGLIAKAFGQIFGNGRRV